MKHDAELQSFNNFTSDQDLETSLNEPEILTVTNDEPKKGNRQQKRKEKKAMQMRQAYQEAKEEAGQSVNYKEIEESDILEQLKELCLNIKEVIFIL